MQCDFYKPFIHRVPNKRNKWAYERAMLEQIEQSRERLKTKGDVVRLTNEQLSEPLQTNKNHTKDQDRSLCTDAEIIQAKPDQVETNQVSVQEQDDINQALLNSRIENYDMSWIQDVANMRAVLKNKLL